MEKKQQRLRNVLEISYELTLFCSFLLGNIHFWRPERFEKKIIFPIRIFILWNYSIEQERNKLIFEAYSCIYTIYNYNLCKFLSLKFILESKCNTPIVCSRDFHKTSEKIEKTNSN